MKKFSYPILLALILGIFMIPSSNSSVKAQCSVLFDVVPCPGFIIGQEESGFGTFTGTEEWSALGKAPFPAPSGDIPYGVRLQRNSATSLYQIERRNGTINTHDVTVAFGRTIPSSGAVPPLNRMDFNYVSQDQSAFPPTVRTFDIMTLLPATSKIISTGAGGGFGLTALCLSPFPFPSTGSPCFGRVGIERQNPTYTLDVNGIIRGTELLTSSDAAFKKDVETIKNPMEIISNLRGTTYSFTDEPIEGFDFAGGTHSGFIAQELENDLPHVVFTDDQGFKSVNYIEIIPYLAEGMKQMNDEKAELERKIDELTALLQANGIIEKAPSATGIFDDTRGAELFQNVPNPFDRETRIQYFLPPGTSNAELLVFDMNGRQIKTFPIVEMGEGAVTLSGNQLEAGMYIYSLIANGQEVETKRMILTK